MRGAVVTQGDPRLAVQPVYQMPTCLLRPPPADAASIGASMTASGSADSSEWHDVLATPSRRWRALVLLESLATALQVAASG